MCESSADCGCVVAHVIVCFCLLDLCVDIILTYTITTTTTTTTITTCLISSRLCHHAASALSLPQCLSVQVWSCSITCWLHWIPFVFFHSSYGYSCVKVEFKQLDNESFKYCYSKLDQTYSVYHLNVFLSLQSRDNDSLNGFELNL